MNKQSKYEKIFTNNQNNEGNAETIDECILHYARVCGKIKNDKSQEQDCSDGLRCGYAKHWILL